MFEAFILLNTWDTVTSYPSREAWFNFFLGRELRLLRAVNYCSLYLSSRMSGFHCHFRFKWSVTFSVSVILIFCEHIPIKRQIKLINRVYVFSIRVMCQQLIKMRLFLCWRNF